MYTLRQARVLKGKTQVEMAGFIGVCRDTYRAIEAEPERATISQAKQISVALDIPVDQIFFGLSST